MVPSSPLVALMVQQEPALGLRPEAARGIAVKNAPRGREDATFALIPSAKAPCLYMRQKDNEDLSCGGDSGPTVSASFTGAIGVVPDSVESVEFVMTDGSRQVGEVADNIWVSPPEAATVSISVDGVTTTAELAPRSSLPASVEVAGLSAEALGR